MFLVLRQTQGDWKEPGFCSCPHGHSTCSGTQTAQKHLPAGPSAAFIHMLSSGTRAAEQCTVSDTITF